MLIHLRFRPSFSSSSTFSVPAERADLPLQFKGDSGSFPDARGVPKRKCQGRLSNFVTNSIYAWDSFFQDGLLTYSPHPPLPPSPTQLSSTPNLLLLNVSLLHLMLLPSLLAPHLSPLTSTHYYHETPTSLLSFFFFLFFVVRFLLFVLLLYLRFVHFIFLLKIPLDLYTAVIYNSHCFNMNVTVAPRIFGELAPFS